MRKPALVAFVAALAVIAVPVVGFAQLSGSHAGTPTDVFTQINYEECGHVTADGTTTGTSQGLSLEVPSDLVLSFTTRLGDFGPREEVLTSFLLDEGARQSPEYSIVGNRIGRTSSTLTWTFDNVPAGSHSVDVWSRMDAAPGADFEGASGAGQSQCVLTVFVAPTVGA